MAFYPTHVCYIRPTDTREGILQQVSAAVEQRVLLVFPARESLRIRPLDLLLIARQGRRSSQEIAVATRNPGLRAEAQAAGLTIFSTVARARRQAWPETNGKQTPVLEIQQEVSPLPLRPVRFASFPGIHQHGWAEWSVFILALLSLSLLTIFMLSTAEIMIMPERVSQVMTLNFSGSPKVLTADLAGHMPVHEINLILNAEGSSSSTGTFQLPEDFAHGEVLLINLSDTPIEIPADLLLRTNTSPYIEFRTVAGTVLEPGEENGQLLAIQAVLPGSSGNVPAETIQASTGLLGAILSVNNPLETSGGLTRQVKTPTRADVDALREVLLEQLRLQAEAEFSSSLESESDRLIPGSIVIDEIIAEEVLPTPGETAETFFLSLRIRFKAWMVSTDDLERVAQQLLNASLSPETSPLEQTLEIIPIADPILEDEQVTWQILFRQQIRTVVDPALLQSFTAKPADRLSEWFDQNLALTEKTVISQKPVWWPWLPPFSSRMELSIQ